MKTASVISLRRQEYDNADVLAQEMITSDVSVLYSSVQKTLFNLSKGLDSRMSLC